jgi:hypothetical protein
MTLQPAHTQSPLPTDSVRVPETRKYPRIVDIEVGKDESSKENQGFVTNCRADPSPDALRLPPGNRCPDLSPAYIFATCGWLDLGRWLSSRQGELMFDQYALGVSTALGMT